LTVQVAHGRNRPESCNTWLAFATSPKAPFAGR